ncbi:MAG: 6-bladed beta-propeller, partial [Nitrosopumilus sp.]|nr:6-bladed beta-propeller [Nitrosopumilus sp.]
MRKYLYLTLVFFIAFSVLSQAHGEKIQVKTVDGVKVIENPKEPAPPKGALTKLSLKEEFSLGQGGTDEEMFSEISGLDVDNDGNIYILDRKERKVKIFDSEGKLFKQFGKEGQGPGEMSMPLSLQITSNNELVVGDALNQRLTFYSLQGEFLRALSTAKAFGLSLPVFDSQGNIVGQQIVTPGSGETRIMQEARKYDGELNPLFTIASIDITNIIQGKINPFQFIIFYQLGKDDSIFFSNLDEYEIKVLNSDGKPVKRILKEYDPVKVTEKDKEEFFERLPGEAAPVKDRIEFPKEYPAYQNFTLDEQGRLFVRTFERGKKEREFFFDVFDPEGQYIAKILFKGEPRV